MVTASSPVLAHAAHLLSDAFFFCSILYIVLLRLKNKKKNSLSLRFRFCLYGRFHIIQVAVQMHRQLVNVVLLPALNSKSVTIFQSC